MVPARCQPLFEACHAVGGRALLVGGSVRDAIMGHPNKDLDIEVHRLSVAQLVEVLGRFGHVNEVGRSFGVLKLRMGRFELDVSVPRRDSRQGSGHKGIRADADPFLGVEEAARRRDLTINAIAYDPLTDTFEDPFHGRVDLRDRRLRAVDAQTFGEDPLRALRVAQFAARFCFDIDPALEDLCRQMPLAELPAERIRGEIEKLLLKGKKPSVGWTLAERTGMWARVVPEWGACPPDLDALAHIRDLDAPRRLALLYAAACAGLSDAAVVMVLDRLRVFRVGGYNVRDQVLFLTRHRAEAEAGLSLTRCRRLADAGELELLALLAHQPALHQDAALLGVLREPLPPLLAGRDLSQLGVPAGPEMGRILARVREEQLEGRLDSADAARAWVKTTLEPRH